jgi:Domain of unknown function (DUF397)
MTPDRWITSSHSYANGNCVEVAWRKSGHSNSVSNCVEAAQPSGEVLVRDSKDPGGPVLRFTLPAWTGFVADVKGQVNAGSSRSTPASRATG